MSAALLSSRLTIKLQWRDSPPNPYSYIFERQVTTMSKQTYNIDEVMSKEIAASEAKTASSVTPEQNLEFNKTLAARIEARVYGIGDIIINDPSVALYEAKGFAFEVRPCPSTKGDIYYNLLGYDLEVPEGEKNEVTRLCIGKVVAGQTSVDNRFSMFIAQLRKDMNDYVVEKRMNYWGRADKRRAVRKSLDEITLAV